MNHIVSPAIKFEDRILLGRSHGGIIADNAMMGGNRIDEDNSISGFITSEGEFVDRTTAKVIAIKAGQCKAGEGQLFSYQIDPIGTHLE